MTFVKALAYKLYHCWKFAMETKNSWSFTTIKNLLLKLKNFQSSIIVEALACVCVQTKNSLVLLKFKWNVIYLFRFFLLNLFPCKQCWSLLKLQWVFAKKKDLTIITKPYWNAICLPFFFLPRSFPCKCALCFSLTFAQHILHKETLFHSPLFKAYLLHKIQK